MNAIVVVKIIELLILVISSACLGYGIKQIQVLHRDHKKEKEILTWMNDSLKKAGLKYAKIDTLRPSITLDDLNKRVQSFRKPS